jgi:hypothetical protein
MVADLAGRIRASKTIKINTLEAAVSMLDSLF